MDIGEFLGELDHGRVSTQLGEQISKIVAEVKRIGRKGALTIKIGVTKESDRAVVAVTASMQLPAEPLPSTLFFFHPKEEGVLTREDARQMNLITLGEQKLARQGNDNE